MDIKQKPGYVHFSVLIYGSVTQSDSECLPYKQKVGGLNPSSPTHGNVAQHGSEWYLDGIFVAGSNPAIFTFFSKSIYIFNFHYYI